MELKLLTKRERTPSVVLDTSFLVAYHNTAYKNHLKVTEMHAHFVREGFHIYLSSIVASELASQLHPDLILHSNYLPLDFILLDGLLAGSLNFKNFLEAGDLRIGVKDDVKILAQMKRIGATYFATEDEKFALKIAKAAPSIRSILGRDTVAQHFGATE